MARPQINDKPLENLGICMSRAPCLRMHVGKKKGDTVIAKPYKTLGKQAFPAGHRPRAPVAGRMHNPWRTLESMEHHWENIVFACAAHPARQVGLGKKNRRRTTTTDYGIE